MPGVRDCLYLVSGVFECQNNFYLQLELSVLRGKVMFQVILQARLRLSNMGNTVQKARATKDSSDNFQGIF